MDCHLPTIRSVNPKSALAQGLCHWHPTVCVVLEDLEEDLRKQTWEHDVWHLFPWKWFFALSLGGKKYCIYNILPHLKTLKIWALLEPWPQEIRRSHDMNLRDLPRLTYLRMKVSCFGSKSMLSSVPMEAQSWAFTRIGDLHFVTHQMGRYPIQNREYWPRIMSWFVAQFGFVWNFGSSTNIWQF